MPASKRPELLECPIPGSVPAEKPRTWVAAGWREAPECSRLPSTGSDAHLADAGVAAGIHHRHELLQGHRFRTRQNDLGMGRIVLGQLLLQLAQTNGLIPKMQTAVALQFYDQRGFGQDLGAAAGRQPSTDPRRGDHAQGDHDKEHQQKKHDVDHGDDLNAPLAGLKIAHLSSPHAAPAD